MGFHINPYEPHSPLPMSRATKTLHPATKTAVDALKPRKTAPGQAAFAAAYDAYFSAPK